MTTALILTYWFAKSLNNILTLSQIKIYFNFLVNATIVAYIIFYSFPAD